jgi:hypothetical protein
MHSRAALQYNTIQYNTIQYNTIQYNTIQYNTIQYNTIQYNTCLGLKPAPAPASELIVRSWGVRNRTQVFLLTSIYTPVRSDTVLTTMHHNV